MGGLACPNLVCPDGMRVVSQEEFLQRLYADRRDIMPCHRMPFFTTWETRDRVVWGWSLPGWKDPGGSKLFAIAVTEF